MPTKKNETAGFIGPSLKENPAMHSILVFTLPYVICCLFRSDKNALDSPCCRLTKKCIFPIFFVSNVSGASNTKFTLLNTQERKSMLSSTPIALVALLKSKKVLTFDNHCFSGSFLALDCVRVSAKRAQAGKPYPL